MMKRLKLSRIGMGGERGEWVTTKVSFLARQMGDGRIDVACYRTRKSKVQYRWYLELNENKKQYKP